MFNAAHNIMNHSFPLYEEISYDITKLIKIFALKKDLIILNSIKVNDDFGRYSFICFDAFASFYAIGLEYFWNNQAITITDPFDFINGEINKYKIEKIADLPPFQGGVMGYFGYESCHYLEKLPKMPNSIKLPDIYLRFYSNVIAFDHRLNKSWIIATGFPQQNYHQRLVFAKDNISRIKSEINNNKVALCFQQDNNGKFINTKITSNFSKKSYIRAVNRAKEYILNGDIFEVNITQQFRAILNAAINPIELYWKLSKFNPAPFSSYLKINDYGYIVSASPERFVQLTDNIVETSPIKGTRPRSTDPREDKILAAELTASEKDYAENIMIVDLMRNDLSKVCQPHSVNVKELCSLKSFATVHHLVSNIRGRLQEHLNAIDLIKATFAPGSVTGAPKLRAMEIISELEGQTRGPYCGCIGYISFTGDLDTSVTIRSYYLQDNYIFFSAGGAITLDSNAEEEYLESIAKAQMLAAVLNGKL